MARAAVARGKCAVIGLQSTGEARTAGAVAERGEELDDFVSGARHAQCCLVASRAGPTDLLPRLVAGRCPTGRVVLTFRV